MNIEKPIVESTDEHSRYGPSGSKRWIGCPASIQMEDSMPKEEAGVPNFYAQEGTCAHEMSEATLIEYDYECQHFIGTEFNGIVVDQNMANHCQTYVNYVKGIETNDSIMWPEVRVSLRWIEDSMFGTADAVVFSDTFLEVVDLKYGQGVIVEAKDNPQLMLYALGVLRYLSRHFKIPPDYEIRGTIVQPRAPHPDGPIRTVTWTVEELENFEKEVLTAVYESKGEDPPFGPNEDRCMWCRAKGECVPSRDWHLEQAGLEFSDFLDTNISFPDKHKMSMAQLQRILKHGKAVDKYIKSVVDHATDLLRAGEEVPGYKLVYGRSVRKWGDPEAAVAALLNYGTDEERLYNKKLLTAPQMQKELTPEEWSEVEQFVIKPTGAVTIAPESDKRESINPNLEAAKDFAE